MPLDEPSAAWCLGGHHSQQQPTATSATPAVMSASTIPCTSATPLRTPQRATRMLRLWLLFPTFRIHWNLVVSPEIQLVYLLLLEYYPEIEWYVHSFPLGFPLALGTQLTGNMLLTHALTNENRQQNHGMAGIPVRTM
jgi:hypothetical protein